MLPWLKTSLLSDLRPAERWAVDFFPLCSCSMCIKTISTDGGPERRRLGMSSRSWRERQGGFLCRVGVIVLMQSGPSKSWGWAEGPTAGQVSCWAMVWVQSQRVIKLAGSKQWHWVSLFCNQATPEAFSSRQLVSVPQHGWCSHTGITSGVRLKVDSLEMLVPCVV